MRLPAALAAVLVGSGALAPCASHAVELNLAALSCAKYEHDVLTSAMPGFTTDPIDTVMWLFGFSTAKSGERVMYGDSLRAFGFALDMECKTNPDETVLRAVSLVKSARGNPMDLTRIDCTAFEPRHVALRRSDPESATTLTMWLFGYAVGLSGGHELNAGAVQQFDAALEDWCGKHPRDSVFDALGAPNPAVPAPR